MTLEQLRLPPDWQQPPPVVETFLNAVEARITRFQLENRKARIPAFMASNLWAVFHALQWVAAKELAVGGRFCEWGSGLGGVTCLAKLLGLDACGIEIEPRLVTAAQKLARDYHIAVDFFLGSYRPLVFEKEVGLESSSATCLELSPTAFDIIYAYPWPAEERLVFTLFERWAPTGALLVSFHGGKDIRVCRRGQRLDNN